MIVYKLDEENLETTNLLAEWELDYSIFSIKHITWTNKISLWRKFIREL